MHAQLIHIIDMVHPLPVNGLKKDHTLNFSDLLRLGEFSFLCLIELNSLFLKLLDKLVLLIALHLSE